MKRLTQFATFFVLAASLRADLVGSLTVTGAEGSDSIAVGGSVRCPGTSVICDGSSDSLVIVVHTFGLSIDGGAGATYGTSYLDFSGISFAGNLPLWQFTVSYAAVNGFTPQDVTLNNGVLAVDLSGVTFAGGGVDIDLIPAPEPNSSALLGLGVVFVILRRKAGTLLCLK